MPRRLLALCITAISALALGLPASAYSRPGAMHLVTRSPLTGKASLGDATDGTTMTPSGRFIAFASDAADLTKVGKSANPGHFDNVYVYDTRTATLRLDSVGMRGLPALGASADPTLSDDGRYLAFESSAPNLVPGDTNNAIDVFVRDLRTGRTLRASVTSSGKQVTITSPGQTAGEYPSVSGNGRYVSFQSTSMDFIPAKAVTSDAMQPPVWLVHGVKSGRTWPVYTNGVRGQYRTDPPKYGNGVYGCNSLDRSGRHEVFVAGSSVFVRDVHTLETVRVDVASDGTPSSGASICPSGAFQTGTTSEATGVREAFVDHMISANGCLAVSVDSGNNLVPNDTTDQGSATGNVALSAGVFVRDLCTGKTERVSTTSDGEERAGTAIWARISANGRYVVWGGSGGFDPRISKDYANSSDPLRRACALVADGQISPPGLVDPCLNDTFVYVHDRTTGTTQAVSLAPNGSLTSCFPNLSGPTVSLPAISEDGRSVTFTSCDSGLVDASDTGPISGLNPQVFLYDRGPALGVGGLARAGLEVGGSPLSTSIISRVDPASDVPAALTALGANLTGASIVSRPQSRDLFVREEVQTMPSVPGTPVVGNPGVLYGLDLTANGVRYEVRVQRVPGPSYDSAGGASFGLFRLGQNGLWRQVATLRGGYGTTGAEVVFSLPLRDLGPSRSHHLRGITAFTGLGAFDVGPMRLLDTARLSRSPTGTP